MNTHTEYLKGIVDKHSLSEDSNEIKALRDARKRVEDHLRATYGSTPRIRYGGSHKKGTMVSTSYDLDILCYFLRDDTNAGETLEDIYDSVRATLSAEYDVNPKRTALRISDKKSGDLRIDVVPGRFVDDDQSDVYLHQSGGSKERLKTNPDKHIKHVADSGVRDVIKLTKVWRHRVDLQAKTFALELLVIKLLADRENDDLDTQFRSLLEAFRDDSDSLCVEDPANSNNDLTPLINEMRSSISSAAAGALAAVDRGGWESVFGPLVEKGDRAGRIAAVASTDTARVKPWAV